MRHLILLAIFCECQLALWARDMGHKWKVLMTPWLGVWYRRWSGRIASFHCHDCFAKFMAMGNMAVGDAHEERF